MKQRSTAKQWLDSVATLLVAVGAVVVTLHYARNWTSATDSGGSIGRVEPMALDILESPTRGDGSSKVAVVVFGDFECQFCREFAARSLPEIERKLVDTGKVLLVFKHFPLDDIHPDARRVSELAACSGDGERFWMTHDWLFQSPSPLSSIRLETLAGEIPLDASAVVECVRVRARALVEADIADAQRLGVRSTPEVLIGQTAGGTVTVTRRLKGALPFEVYESVIANVLASGR